MSFSSKIRRKKKELKRKRNIGIVVAIFSVVLLIFFILFSLLVFVAFAAYDLPKLKKKDLLGRNAQTSKIYDSQGNLITNLYVEQNRVEVPLSQISKYVQDAVITVEDKRFYQHQGVDWKAIARAFFADVEEGKIVEGGSTLTQQCIKNTLITPKKTFKRKVREAVLAYQVEKKMSKKQILQGYLNTIYFGQSSYGVETAAETFFGKNSADLNIAEAALLAGVIRSPNDYSPYMHPDAALKRRNWVIKQMLKSKKITKQQAEEALATPLQVKAIEAKPILAPYFVDYVKQQILEDKKFGSTYSQRAAYLFQGGLRIYTTIDPRLQSLAEQAAWGILNQPGDPEVSLVAIEPQTGYIKAMVGGRDYQTQKFNLAVQGLRQPGSSFKPFVLATAIEQGIPVSKSYNSNPGVLKVPGGHWKVNNAEGHGAGMMSLRSATIHSVNAVFARLILDVKPENVVETAKKLGITSPLNPFPAIALGGLSKGVSALEMASAYSSFANQGFHTPPIAITKVTDAKGKVIEENQPKSESAISPVTAYMVTEILSDVIRFGTGRAANIGRPSAGKTGTTENFGDAWFAGYTPNLSTAVWVGYPDKRLPLRNVHGIRVYGGTFPARIWRAFMSSALSGTPAQDFTKPTSGMVSVRICQDTGLLATKYCPNTRYQMFPKGASPRRYCPIHTAPETIEVPNVVGLSAISAVKQLTDLGFQVSQELTPNDTIPSGQVVSQSPEEHSQAPKGSTVVITIATPSAKTGEIEVPDLTGKSESEALSLLRNLGLVGSVIYQPTSDASQAGKVVSQQPGPLSKVAAGSVIEIEIGKI